MSSPCTTQAPTAQEIETFFIRVLSNGPLSLEDITDRINGFGRGHEDAVVAVFEYMAEAVQGKGEGEATYQLRPEYRPTTTITNSERETEEEEQDFTPTLLRAPPTNNSRNHATPSLSSTSSPRRKTPPAHPHPLPNYPPPSPLHQLISAHQHQTSHHDHAHNTRPLRSPAHRRPHNSGLRHQRQPPDPRGARDEKGKPLRLRGRLLV
ncbi:hypothetical protein GGP41_001682 [Bipolaris sorokiniana]|uniref:Uncharacterized protein n=2 Tax=Cochliobolus sativus TaxID=45130 RepID=A0A8H6DYV8_COCSA|nr:uncharacterized protein COCSADRAFT_33077 [Bipolaris sorokiniana ND90Pr]EMD68111.1 hypothetical protein COCSADRAFT_33077 [Bipolaris sorokiniana ND90Pr]KAF5853127.1 hypothetical protein GGP41_001682 [Bipolaris sorokiniana]